MQTKQIRAEQVKVNDRIVIDHVRHTVTGVSLVRNHRGTVVYVDIKATSSGYRNELIGKRPDASIELIEEPQSEPATVAPVTSADPVKTQEQARAEFSNLYEALRADGRIEGYGVDKREEWLRFIAHGIEEGYFPQDASAWKMPRSTRK